MADMADMVDMADMADGVTWARRPLLVLGEDLVQRRCRCCSRGGSVLLRRVGRRGGRGRGRLLLCGAGALAV
jgi:hypothetical protein